jgi:hypothetical protein
MLVIFKDYSAANTSLKFKCDTPKPNQHNEELLLISHAFKNIFLASYQAFLIK